MSEPRSGARSREVYRALQRQARKEGRGTQELFEFYLLERFLYRLSISEYRDHFVLFDTSSARTTMIREQEVYPGTRIVVPANLGTARLQLRLDINVGDPVHPRQITYPTVLSDEPFTLLGYPVETVVAEKVDTMITRGDANTRERDYADVLMLSRTHALEARALRKALEATAAYRGTELLPLTDALDTLPTARQASWRALVDRNGLTDVLPESFEQAVRQVSEFVDPVLRSDPGLDRWNPSARAWT